MAALAEHDAVLVKQTPKGCLMEMCCGCDANREYKISRLDKEKIDGFFLKDGAMDEPNILYVMEKSPFIQRMCFQTCRGYELSVYEGDSDKGNLIYQFKKPFSAPPTFCCCLPNMSGKVMGEESNGAVVTSTRVLFKCCSPVPQFAYAENNTDTYFVHPPLCCGGCCINPECSKGCKKCLATPFYIHDAPGDQRLKDSAGNDAMICKMWSGWKKECCTTADNFSITFPTNCTTTDRKLGLIGSAFIIDFVVFENQNQDN